MAKTEGATGFPVSSVSGSVGVLVSPGCNEARPDGALFILPLVGIQRWLSHQTAESLPSVGLITPKERSF